MLLTITFRIPNDVAARLTALPYKGHTSVSAILNVMVREIVYEKLGVPYDPERELADRGTV